MSHKGICLNDDPSMRGNRERTHQGTMRRVRSDKEAGYIEEQYGVVIPGRSDQQLGTLLKKYDVDSQTQLIKKLRKNT